MGITVTEKEHWKQRIEKKIQKRIDTLVATQQPNYLDSVEREAREEAIRSLGIEKYREKLAHIQSRIEKLEKERDEVKAMEVVAVTGCSQQEATAHPGHRYYCPVEKVITQAKGIAIRTIMASDSLGQTILALRDEQEELLDTVWLSTSSKQIRELWVNVTELINDQPTVLQQAALDTEPAEVA